MCLYHYQVCWQNCSVQSMVTTINVHVVLGLIHTSLKDPFFLRTFSLPWHSSLAPYFSFKILAINPPPPPPPPRIFNDHPWSGDGYFLELCNNEKLSDQAEFTFKPKYRLNKLGNFACLQRTRPAHHFLFAEAKLNLGFWF